MFPILFEYGDWQIRSYNVILCIAIVACTIFMYRAARQKGFPKSKLAWLLTGIVLFALLGARINGWFFWYPANTEMLSIDLMQTRHGMTAFGGLAGAAIFVIAFARINRWKTWVLLDLLAPTLVLGEAIQRLGCSLNGCCYGKTTSSIFGFYLPDIMGIWAQRFPSQWLTGIFCLFLFYYLLKQSGNKTKSGEVFVQYLILYPMGRLMLDFLRGDEPLAFGIFTKHQFISILLILVGVIIALIRNPDLKQTKIMEEPS